MTKYYTYKNKMVFKKTTQNVTNQEILDALEDSPIVKDKTLIGYVTHVQYRKPNLFYGDIVTNNKEYAKGLIIDTQRMTFDKSNKLKHIVSYLKIQ